MKWVLTSHPTKAARIRQGLDLEQDEALQVDAPGRRGLS